MSEPNEPVVRYCPEVRLWRATRGGVYAHGLTPEEAVASLTRAEHRLKQMIQNAMHRDDTTESAL